MEDMEGEGVKRFENIPRGVDASSVLVFNSQVISD